VDEGQIGALPHRAASLRHQVPTLGITKAEWDRFAELIRSCGVSRTWRGHGYRYLIINRKCYWVDWPALNCANVATLDPLSKPSRTPQRKRINP